MNTGGNAGGTLSPYLTPLLSSWFIAQYGDDVGWRLSLAIAGPIVVAGAALWLGVSPPFDPDGKPGKRDRRDLRGEDGDVSQREESPRHVVPPFG